MSMIAEAGEPLTTELLRTVRQLQVRTARLLGDRANPLTRRELSVLSFVAQGLTNVAIAHRLGIAENTVKNHLRNVHQKLDVRCRTEAVMVAVRAGWLDVR